METISLDIDGHKVEAIKGKSVLRAALDAGIYIPHICSQPNIGSIGACRLCIVEIEGIPGLITACTTTAEDEMVVKTKTPEIMHVRRLTVELIMAAHPSNCEECPKYLNCELQSLAQYLEVAEQRVRRQPKAIAVDSSNPLFLHDFHRCILCGRCVRVCHELRGVGILSFMKKGGETCIGTAFDNSLADAGCRFCGACVEICPTGALRDQNPHLGTGRKRREALTPCKTACPMEIDVPRYVRLISEGKFDESYAVVREKLPLPSVCSYICLSYCEEQCRRGDVNEPIGIRELKRFVSENHTDLWKKDLIQPEATGKKVAILGSGPAGLTAAYYLARKGHDVTVFEQAPLPGGMLRQAISRKRLPREALEDDIQEIIQMGVKLELNVGDIRIGQLFDDGFDAVFLAIGSTFVGQAAYRLKEEEIDLTSWGSIKVDPSTMTTSRKGVFAGGDSVVGSVSEDLIRYASSETGGNFYSFLVEGLARKRGDSFRSATRAIASGKKAAGAIDRYLDGSGDFTETLLPPEEVNMYLGRKDGFAYLERIPEDYHSPVPQFAGLNRAEPPLDPEAAMEESERCLRCDLRFKIPPNKFWASYQYY